MVEQLVEQFGEAFAQAWVDGRVMTGVWFVDRPELYYELLRGMWPWAAYASPVSWRGVPVWLYGDGQIEDARGYLRGLGWAEGRILAAWPVCEQGVWMTFLDGSVERLAE